MKNYYFQLLNKTYFINNIYKLFFFFKNYIYIYIYIKILDNNPKLYFHLQQQKLIEFIKQGKIMEAIEFAQEELAPRGEENVIIQFFFFFFFFFFFCLFYFINF